MKRFERKIMGVVAVAAAVAVSVCETTGGARDSVAGAGIGAALGCGIGALVKGSRGCAVGAAVGAAAGLAYVAINHYQAKQVRTSTADRRVYGVTTQVSSTQVKIRSGSNSPTRVRPGQPVNIITDYSVLLPPGKSSTVVSESWVLKQDGKTVTSLPTKTETRDEGGWKSQAEITIPQGTPPGTYVIEHKVKAGSSYDTDTSSFVVRA
jgi:hypothetical protein